MLNTENENAKGMDTDFAHRLLAENGPPRAAAMIVTLYGDVIDPRGGELWMGDLIENCAKLGLSETLVRTAVSRLVSAGQLTGTRQGRRSYYSLTPSARVEYRRAAERIYGPLLPANGWSLLITPDSAETASTAGFVHMGNGLWLAPGRVTHSTFGGTVMHSQSFGDTAALTRLVARHWDIGAHAQYYAHVLDRFTPVLDMDCHAMDSHSALIVRLCLVHDYRNAILRDPCLPQDALPDDWPAPAARALFARLYASLTPACELAVPQAMSARDGPLAAATDLSRARLDLLKT